MAPLLIPLRDHRFNPFHFLAASPGRVPQPFLHFFIAWIPCRLRGRDIHLQRKLDMFTKKIYFPKRGLFNSDQ